MPTVAVHLTGHHLGRNGVGTGVVTGSPVAMAPQDNWSTITSIPRKQHRLLVKNKQPRALLLKIISARLLHFGPNLSNLLVEALIHPGVKIYTQPIAQPALRFRLDLAIKLRLLLTRARAMRILRLPLSTTKDGL